MGGKLSILKIWRLLHIHIFIHKAMKETIADINLPESPAMRNSKRENQTDNSRLHNRTKGITIVNALLLSEASGN
jgi:hypothetical protein